MQTPSAEALEQNISDKSKVLVERARDIAGYPANPARVAQLQEAAVAYVAELARAGLAVALHRRADDSISLTPGNIARLDPTALGTPELGRLLSAPRAVPGPAAPADGRPHGEALSDARRHLRRACDDRARAYLETSGPLLEPVSATYRAECLERRRHVDSELERASIRFGREHDRLTAEAVPGFLRFGAELTPVVSTARVGDPAPQSPTAIRAAVAELLTRVVARREVTSADVERVIDAAQVPDVHREGRRVALETFGSLVSAGWGPLEIGEILDVAVLDDDQSPAATLPVEPSREHVKNVAWTPVIPGDYSELRKSRAALVGAAAEARDAYNARRACHLDQREIDAVRALQQAAVRFTAELDKVVSPGTNKVAIADLADAVQIDGTPSATTPSPSPKPSPIDSARHVMGALREVAHALGVDGPQELESGANERIANLCKERIKALKNVEVTPAMRDRVYALLLEGAECYLPGTDEVDRVIAAVLGTAPTAGDVFEAFAPRPSRPRSNPRLARQASMVAGFGKPRAYAIPPVEGPLAQSLVEAQRELLGFQWRRGQDAEIQRSALRFAAVMWRVCGIDLVPVDKVRAATDRLVTSELRDMVGSGGLTTLLAKVAADLSPDVASELEAIAWGIK